MGLLLMLLFLGMVADSHSHQTGRTTVYRHSLDFRFSQNLESDKPGVLESHVWSAHFFFLMTGDRGKEFYPELRGSEEKENGLFGQCKILYSNLYFRKLRMHFSAMHVLFIV